MARWRRLLEDHIEKLKRISTQVRSIARSLDPATMIESKRLVTAKSGTVLLAVASKLKIVQQSGVPDCSREVCGNGCCNVSQDRVNSLIPASPVN